MSQPMEGVPDGQALGLPVPPGHQRQPPVDGHHLGLAAQQILQLSLRVLPRKLVQANIPSPKQCNFHLVLLLTLVCRSWPGGLR